MIAAAAQLRRAHLAVATMQRLKIHHETRYSYGGPVGLGEHQLRLRPREGPDLRIESSMLDIQPAAQVRWARDAFDNAVANLVFEEAPVEALSIVSEVTVQKFDAAPLDFVLSDFAVEHPVAYPPEDADILRPYFANYSEEQRDAAYGWAARSLNADGPIQTYVLLDRLCRAINSEFSYQAREEPGVQTATMTLERGVGSCRDFANLFLEAARALGLAARFVSGYRYEEGLPVELGATHAWAEVYLPGAGWKGFDPTIGELSDWRHIATAVARSPSDAPPVAGDLLSPAVSSTLGVLVDVQVL